MIWVTWRQHRAQFISGGAICAVLAVLLLVTGLAMGSTYHSLGIDTCLAATRTRDCNMLVTQFKSEYSALQFLVPLFLLLPVSLGVFWGAPLVAREVEQGTHRLAWTQSVTRRRWTVTKLLVVGLVAVVLSSAYSAVLWWWADPLVSGPPNDRFSYGIFDLLGVVPVAYKVFAIALGVAFGVVLRRTTSAMVATLCGFAAVRLAVELVLRPHYQPAISASYPLAGVKASAGTPAGAWILSQDTVTASGVSVSGGGGVGIDLGPVQQICSSLGPTTGPDSPAMQQCIAQNGIHVAATFQPYDRYWLFQGVESALFILLAAVLVRFSLWWIRRRMG